MPTYFPVQIFPPSHAKKKVLKYVLYIPVKTSQVKPGLLQETKWSLKYFHGTSFIPARYALLSARRELDLLTNACFQLAHNVHVKGAYKHKGLVSCVYGHVPRKLASWHILYCTAEMTFYLGKETSFNFMDPYST